MRKIYQKYFEIPEENKGIMGEHVFFARLAVSIACIVLCMSAMGFSAYAYFTASVSSNMNQLKAASFDLEVQQSESQTEATSVSSENGKIYTLQPNVTYCFTLKRVINDGSATTGYCKIVIMKDETTEEDSVYTRQFGKSKLNESLVDDRIILIKVNKETMIKFIPCWGTHNVEETNRFDEQAKMIVVPEGMPVTFEDIPTPQTVNETVDTVTDSPAVTNKPTTSSTLSETPSTTSTESATSTDTTTATESATSTEATSVTEPETSTEITTTTESTDGKNSEEDSES